MVMTLVSSVARTVTLPAASTSAPAPVKALVEGVKILIAAEPAPASPPEPIAAPAASVVTSIPVSTIVRPSISGVTISNGVIDASAVTVTSAADSMSAPAPIEASVLVST